MAGYQGHFIGGLVAFVVVLQSTVQTTSIIHQPFGLIIALLLSLSGALFPDIDIKSHGQRIFYWLLFIGLLLLVAYRQWYKIAGIGLMACVPMIVKHRGLTHHPIFIILFPWLVYDLLIKICCIPQGLYAYFVWYFIAGGFSHLLLDFGFLGTVKRVFAV